MIFAARKLRYMRRVDYTWRMHALHAPFRRIGGRRLVSGLIDFAAAHWFDNGTGLGKGMSPFTVLEGNRTLTRFVLPAKESADHAMKA